MQKNIKAQSQVNATMHLQNTKYFRTTSNTRKHQTYFVTQPRNHIRIRIYEELQKAFYTLIDRYMIKLSEDFRQRQNIKSFVVC